MKKILKYKDKSPKIRESVFLADGVMIIGDVNIEDKSNVWYNTGHGHLGWTLSAYTANEIANKILED